MSSREFREFVNCQIQFHNGQCGILLTKIETALKFISKGNFFFLQKKVTYKPCKKKNVVASLYRERNFLKTHTA